MGKEPQTLCSRWAPQMGSPGSALPDPLNATVLPTQHAAQQVHHRVLELVVVQPAEGRAVVSGTSTRWHHGCRGAQADVSVAMQPLPCGSGPCQHTHHAQDFPVRVDSGAQRCEPQDSYPEGCLPSGLAHPVNMWDTGG